MDTTLARTAVRTRFIDQEPDTIALIPDHPGYFIVGTYSLIPTEQGQVQDTATARRGSLQVFSRSCTASSLPKAAVDRLDFSFGVYDIHFHPRYTKLLGVATSNAEVLFFWVREQAETKTSSGIRFKLCHLGTVTVEEPHEDDGRLAIVTQFLFIDNYHTTNSHASSSTIDSHLDILFVATTQFGNTKLFRTSIIGSPFGSQAILPDASQYFNAQTITIHKQAYDLEAWTMLPIMLTTSQSAQAENDELRSVLILSGGDDSQLIISQLTLPEDHTLTDSGLDLDELIVTKVHTDRRIHTAGIIALCYIPDVPAFRSPLIGTIVLTGSYDEHIRAFLLVPPSAENPRCKFTLLSEFKMPGSVWRIVLLDDSPALGVIGKEYILLIAGHTSGVFIVRLRIQMSSQDVSCPHPNPNNLHFVWTIEKHFESHESLVYAVTADRVADQGRDWAIISSSFYDKMICEWTWNDGQNRSAAK